MKTLNLNPLQYVVSIFFNPMPRINCIIETAVEKALAYKPQNPLGFRSLAVWIFMFVILVFRLDYILFCLYSQNATVKKFNPKKRLN